MYRWYLHIYARIFFWKNDGILPIFSTDIIGAEKTIYIFYVYLCTWWGGWATLLIVSYIKNKRSHKNDNDYDNGNDDDDGGDHDADDDDQRQ